MTRHAHDYDQAWRCKCGFMLSSKLQQRIMQASNRMSQVENGWSLPVGEEFDLRSPYPSNPAVFKIRDHRHGPRSGGMTCKKCDQNLGPGIWAYHRKHSGKGYYCISCAVVIGFLEESEMQPPFSDPHVKRIRIGENGVPTCKVEAHPILEEWAYVNHGPHNRSEYHCVRHALEVGLLESE